MLSFLKKERDSPEIIKAALPNSFLILPLNVSVCDVVIAKFDADKPWLECRISGISSDRKNIKFDKVDGYEPYYIYSLNLINRWVEVKSIELKTIKCGKALGDNYENILIYLEEHPNIEESGTWQVFPDNYKLLLEIYKDNEEAVNFIKKTISNERKKFEESYTSLIN